MRNSVAILAGVVFLFAGAASCFAADKVDNPQYQSWSKFKPGTTITVLTLSDTGTQKDSVEKTSTLVSVSADMVVLEEKQLIINNGLKINQKPWRTKVPVKIDPDAGVYDGVHGGTSAEKPQIKESDEEVAVAGKKVKCKLAVSTYPGGGASLVNKTWTSDDVPGHLVKSETVMSGPNMATVTTTITLTAMTVK